MQDNRSGITVSVDREGNNSLILRRVAGSSLENDIDMLCAKIKELPAVESLQFEAPDVTSSQIKRVFEHLSGSGLGTLTIRSTMLNDESITAMAEMVKTLPKLQRLNFSSNALVAKDGIAPVLDAMRDNAKQLRTLNLYNTILSTEEAESVAELVKNSPKLEELNLNHCEVGEDSRAMDAIAAVLPSCRNLRHLQFDDFDDKVATHLSTKTNPNLFSAHSYVQAINTLSTNNRDSAIRRFKPLAEVEHGLGSATLRNIFACAEVMPLLEYLSYSQESPVPRERFLQLKAYLDNPPAIPDTLEALTAPDSSGRAPLEHPASWQHIGAILETQEKNGTPLNKEFLLSGTAKGESWLEIALASAAETVIPELNKHHIRIPPSDLLCKNADGDTVASPLLEAAIANDHPEAFFTIENLRGASSGDVTRLFAALPENTQARIPNINTLKQQVQATAPTRQGLGR